MPSASKGDDPVAGRQRAVIQHVGIVAEDGRLEDRAAPVAGHGIGPKLQEL